MIRGTIKSPFQTYDTYSHKMAQVDGQHHFVNLGVPGYTSVHGNAFARRILDRFQQDGVSMYVESATIYFGNNDSVNNGNIQDKYFIGDDIKRQFHAAGLLEERFTSLFNATRVDAGTYADNLKGLIEELRRHNVKNISLIVPVVPYDWPPGQRAVSDAQEVINKQYESRSKSSALYKDAQESFAEYLIAASKKSNVESQRYAREAIEEDFMVPRRKQQYVQSMAEVAHSMGTNFINIEPLLPIQDRRGPRSGSARDPENITNDYCHPGERVNIYIAAAESIALGIDTADVESKTISQLEKLGVNPEVARSEIRVLFRDCIIRPGASKEDYMTLASAQRTRRTWNDEQ